MSESDEKFQTNF